MGTFFSRRRGDRRTVDRRGIIERLEPRLLLAWTGVMNGDEVHLTGTDGGHVTLYTRMSAYMTHDLTAADGFETVHDFDPATPGEQRLANAATSRISVTPVTPEESIRVVVASVGRLEAQLTLNGGAGAHSLQIYDDHGTASSFHVGETTVMVDDWALEFQNFSGVALSANEQDNTIVVEGYHAWTNINSGSGNDVVQFVYAGGVGSPVSQAAAFTGPGDDRIEVIGGPIVALFGGGDGRDTLIGGAGDDTLSGERHGDWVDGRGGRDTLNGGLRFGKDKDSDTIVADLYDDVFTNRAEDDVILRASDGDDILSFGDDPASAVAVWRSVSLDLLGGNDVVHMGTVHANMTVLGGAGDDRVVAVAEPASEATLVLDGGDGADTFRLHGTPDDDAFDVQDGTIRVNDGLVTFAGTEALILDAGGGDDRVRIVDHAMAMTVIGGAGDDVVRLPVAGLGLARLRVIGDEGNDQLQLNGTAVAEAFRVNPGAIGIGPYTVRHQTMNSIQISGGRGDDLFTLKDQTAAVTLSGGNGDDLAVLLATNAGAVWYNGGAGADGVRYVGSEGDDAITVGRSTIYAASFSTRLLCVEHITVEGHGGNDVLDATMSNTGVTLLGGQGDDLLVGSTRGDLLRSGIGEDIVRRGRYDVVT